MRKKRKIKLPPKLRQAVKQAGKPVKGVTKKGGGKSGKKKKNPIEAMKEDFRRKLKRIKWSRVFQQGIPYIVFGYFGDVIGCAYRVTNAADFFNRLLGAINNLGVVMSTRIDELLQMVDDGALGFIPGVDLSYLVAEQQYWVLDL